jgi:hypothetical protein
MEQRGEPPSVLVQITIGSVSAAHLRRKEIACVRHFTSDTYVAAAISKMAITQFGLSKMTQDMPVLARLLICTDSVRFLYQIRWAGSVALMELT